MRAVGVPPMFEVPRVLLLRLRRLHDLPCTRRTVALSVYKPAPFPFPGETSDASVAVGSTPASEPQADEASRRVSWSACQSPIRHGAARHRHRCWSDRGKQRVQSNSAPSRREGATKRSNYAVPTSGLAWADTLVGALPESEANLRQGLTACPRTISTISDQRRACRGAARGPTTIGQGFATMRTSSKIAGCRNCGI